MLNPCNDHSPKCNFLSYSMSACVSVSPSSLICHLHYYDEMQISLKDTSVRPHSQRMRHHPELLCCLVLLPYFNMCAICHMPYRSLALVSLSMHYVCAFGCVPGVCCMCVILMQITFPVFELQLVDTCVRVCAVMLVYICIYVCVHVFVCAYFACRHTFSTKYYTILLKKSTTDRPGQRAHKCSPFSLSISVAYVPISIWLSHSY